MIISHKYRFIWFKTEKTASSSLRRLLLDVCKHEPAIDNTDLVSRWRGTSVELGDFSVTPRKRGWTRRHLPQIFGLHTHAKAAQVRAIVGNSIFDDYFKFSSERNPWDRQLSLYSQRSQKKGRVNLEQFDRDLSSPFWRAIHYTRLNNWDIYSIDDRPCVDFMIRFERLNEDVSYVLDRIGYRGGYQLPHNRVSRQRKSYREFYTKESRYLVEKWYQKEIREFQYEF